jgi:ribosome biogenesis GTPase
VIKARVYKSGKREFECKVIDTNEMVMATALGNLLKGDENSIVVGDYVMIEKHVIMEVLPRHNEIFRLIVREQKKKVTASNCDIMVILNSASKPEYKRGIVDRFLVRAHQWNLHPIVVFNKMDQYEPSMFDIKFEEARLKNLNVECFEISAIDKQYSPKYLKFGLQDLIDRLKNKTSVFLGQSGVGKSKTISLVSDGKIQLLSKDVGRAGKGTHTTTWSEIISSDDFTMIDSPGIRSFGVEDLMEEDLLSYFPDLETFAVQCKFTNCNHQIGTKGCYFRDKINEDDYDGQLILSRLDSLIRLNEEISTTPSYLKNK